MKVLKLFVLFAAASMSDPTNCYILDVFLLLYSIIFTALYFREKVSWMHAQIVPSEDIYLMVLNTNLCSALWLSLQRKGLFLQSLRPRPVTPMSLSIQWVIINRYLAGRGSCSRLNILQYVLTYIALNASFLLWSAFYLIKY